MGDSEDEYDRKRRDKFRGERTESYPRGESRRGGGTDERRRDDWIDRESWGSRNRQRTDYRDYRGGGGRERYSPAHSQDMVQPMKRMKTEWDDRRTGGYGHDGGGYVGGYRSWGQDSYPPQHNYGAHMNNQRDMQSMETQPAMMSFKMFLQTQDDNITDEDAIKKYNDYKLEFKRQQLNEFFMAHKDEEWFKIKYHPEDSVKRKEEQMNSLKNRIKVFLEFMENGRMDKVSIDAHHSEQLMNLLDAVVIRLEGGTDFDLTVLDEPSSPNASPEEPAVASKDQCAEKPLSPGSKPADKKDSDDELDIEDKDSVTSVKETLETKPATPDQDDEKAEQKSEKSDKSDKSDKSVKSVKSDKSDKSEKSDKSDDSDNDSPDEEPPPPGLEGDQSDDDDDTVLAKLKVAEPKTESKKRKRSQSIEPDVEENKSDVEMEDISDKEDSSLKLDKADNEDETKKDAGAVDVKLEEKPSEPEEPKPRSLHRTVSIFLRTLAPSITKQEVEAMCKRYPGFLRVAIADPQPERKWFRRGWVTFQREVNIKEICWNLNNIRLRDCELGAIVNRDLSRRIRTVNGITVHKQVVRHDIKLSARIVHNLDSRNGLWCDEGSAEQAPLKTKTEDVTLPSFGLVSKNPVLKNITDYLIEEASAEEEELLGQSGDHEDGQLADDSGTFDRDEALIKVLDRLLLYLRIVHSVDYYNHCEYPNEDEMPNRCGIMHARASPPMSKVTPQELSDYCRTFETKVSCFLQPPPPTLDEDYDKLGCKDPDVEVEKFIQVNTQELAKDKWLCPLSGKKFKGPEFVRKHIFNKHAEKVEEVKKEVEYFNNYLRDPRRPQLAEHPGKRMQRDCGPDQNFSSPGPYMPPYQYNNFGRHMNYGGHPYGGGYGYGHGYGRPNRGFNRGRGGGDYRPVIHYRDLDAPRDIEEII